MRRTFARLFLFGFATGALVLAADSSSAPLEQRFVGDVRPFFETYCFECHGGERPKGDLDLSAYGSRAPVASDLKVLDLAVERIDAEEMPPKKAERHPTRAERDSVLEWIRAFAREEAARNAGDPGPVLPRRLSNAEYDYTVRDLTGVDLGPARLFPVDPANEAGFDNSGESLAMSPALFSKYLEAAQKIAEHVILEPHGFSFAPHPVVAESDRDKYCVQRIVRFYEKHEIDLAEYFFAAWRFLRRDALGIEDAAVADIARDAGLSARYLETIWTLLSDTTEATDPIASLRERWRALPVPADGKSTGGVENDEAEAVARRACEVLRDDVVELRRQLTPRVGKLDVRGISDGSQPFVLWMDRERARNRRRYATGEDRAEERPIESQLLGAATDGDLAGLATGLELFSSVFPDAFFISKRGHYSDPDLGKNVRLLSAGFHLMQGYFRDDAPLYELVLDDAERREIDDLWRELDFATSAPMRQYKDFIFFERAEPPRFAGSAEFDFARSEDDDVTSDEKIRRFADVYLAKARERGADAEAIAAIETYFAEISRAIRSVEEARQAAEPSHIAALRELAERAYRRPLSPAESKEIEEFYRALRDGGLDHENAIRDSVTAVLLSPYFLYRIDLPVENAGPEAGEAAAGESTPDAVRPLSDYSLASRLSYFLWSTLPDRELLDHAAAGDLHSPQVLVAESRRMLRDPRVRAFATEFGGNWLDFRRFEEHQAVDRERFPSFTDELRQSMFEEPIRFFVDLVERDGSILDLIYADYTFVDAPLARHYGMPFDEGDAKHTGSNDDWVRIDGVRRFGRGGILPMAVFLTKNAPGLRTSPVKRGYWVVRRVLGERIPPPPPKVPELPRDEAALGELTLREVLERHRADESCAGCHARFDSVGLALEGYGPIGERRDVDLGGRPVDARAKFPGGGEGEGLGGLIDYLRNEREDDFTGNFCRKVLVYALGRSLLPTDEPLIETLRERLAAEGFRFGALVEGIVTSRQFLHVRVSETTGPR